MLNLKNSSLNVIFVDDEKAELEAYKSLLESMGITNITTVQDSRNVMSCLKDIYFPIVFLDLSMPHKSGIDVLKEIKEEMPHVPVIICTAYSEIETAVECIKLGAHDYLVKPISLNSFGSALRNAIEIASLRNEVLSLKGVNFNSKLNNPEEFKNIVTKDEKMLNIFKYTETIATTGQPVLILGETGTGKELLAKSIHNLSKLEGDFVAVNLAGLDDTLFSDAIFGHVKGAYTGADKDRKGLIEKAAHGTLFLDEIGDLSESSQVKLLRLLQEGTYYPLGSDTLRFNKARIISAANKEINQLVGIGKNIRKDLYYRLSTHLIKLPPLRKRKNDIPLLISFLVEEAAKSMDRTVPKISKDFIDFMTSQNFEGNIRELKTYIYDAVAMCTSDTIEIELISDRLSEDLVLNQSDKNVPNPRFLEKIFGSFPTLKEVSNYTVGAALAYTNNNQNKAAQLLGISKQALSKRIRH